MPSNQRRRSAQRQLELEHRAHHMRHNQTSTEQALWAELRGGQLSVAFRRQVVISRFIADFACSAARLVVEVDGGIHRDRARLDAHRDELLRREGYRVLCIPATLVRSNLAAAVALVRAALAR